MGTVAVESAMPIIKMSAAQIAPNVMKSDAHVLIWNQASRMKLNAEPIDTLSKH